MAVLEVEPPFVLFGGFEADQEVVDSTKVWRVRRSWELDGRFSDIWILGKALNPNGVDIPIRVLGTEEEVVAKIVAARKAAK